MTIEFLLLATVVFLLAGFVKGVVGFGLPTVALAGMALATGPLEAMALLLAPSFAANAWQALDGGRLREILGRFWTFLPPMAVGAWLASGLLARADALPLSALLGAALALYGGTGLAGLQPPRPGRRSERWLTPAVGGANGVVTGLTGTFVVPSALYLQSLRMAPALQVQTMGVFYFAATCALGLGLAGRGLIPESASWLSVAAVAPALGGWLFGARLRPRLDERRFRRIFFVAIALAGAWLVAKGAAPV